MISYDSSSNRVTRRSFLASAAITFAGRIFGQEPNPERASKPSSKGATSGKQPSHALDLSMLPNFCAHEHWGSIDSIGVVAEGFRADVERGATPRTKTGLL